MDSESVALVARIEGRVALVNSKRDTRLQEALSEGQARDTGTDDEDREFIRHVLYRFPQIKEQ
jgi:hypothetical protein